MRGLSAVFSLWLGIITLASAYPCNVYAEDPPIHQLTWGSQGTGPGQFSFIGGIGLDTQGNVYVADANNRIQKFSTNGVYLNSFGSGGSGQGEFNEPFDVAVDDMGSVYVADYGNARIQVFDSDYTFIREWPTPGPPAVPYQVRPLSIALDPTNQYLYVRGYPNAMYIYTIEGLYVTAWDVLSPDVNLGFGLGSDNRTYIGGGNADALYVYKNGLYYAEWGTTGSGDGQFDGCGAVALDTSDNVYVTDGTRRIQKFTSTGGFLSTFGGGYFSSLPHDMVVDAQSNVFVTDDSNYRIHKFSIATANRRSTWGRLKTLYR